VSADIVSLLDIFPTLLDLAGISLKLVKRHIDGQSVLDSLLARHSPHPSKTLYFYCHQTLVGARVGRYKVYFRRSLYPNATELRSFVGEGGFPKDDQMTTGCPSEMLRPWLVYDVETDPSELWPVSVERLGIEISTSFLELLRLPKPNGEVRDSILTLENWRRGLAPCCNPPYCSCSDGRRILFKPADKTLKDSVRSAERCWDNSLVATESQGLSRLCSGNGLV
jgi:hypothetical protein